MGKEPYSGKITDILIRTAGVDPETLGAAEEKAAQQGERLEKYLVEKGVVESDAMVLALSEYLGLAPMNVTHLSPHPHLLELIPREALKKQMLIPVARVAKQLTLAVADPFDLPGMDEIASMTGLQVVPLVASEQDINEVLSKLFAENTQGLDMEELMRDDSDVQIVEDADAEQSLDEMLETAEGAPVIRMVNMMLVEALRTGASDIHIEPMEKSVRLRYRIDGKLTERPGPPKNLQNAVISRIKIMSDLDIAERRIPQDGRFNIKALGKEIDLRISILPTVHGEKVVMRTLDKSTLSPNLAALGLDNYSEKAMTHAIAQPHGIILVTGPTGSGKTTTLYSCLQELNQPDVNIITCEDPVEYQLAGVNQVQMHSEVGLNFSSALRSILRQDPDIVLVGEIRDGETAEIAIKAALTGHLVLSTLHTNSAPGAITRLIDMGIEPFMLGSALVLAQAQRLYRRICPACRKPAEVSAEVLERNHIDSNFFDGTTIYKANGCPRCSNGFKGRGAIMEVLLLNDDIRNAIIRGANTSEILHLGIEAGMVSLKQAGLTRVKDGLTSLEAALEVTGGD
ncbi:MAG: Flp pilus assembly complex ATPase component TadA [Verrucomicrobia bacterium]|jgi:type IV pilus assembly protein PilB|nr:Flp pilus assembly complex ATPase component TadA [Verrucomicrobiota bacterium]MBT7064976.1 Flp pilus assembly complex ATPase component TadA [Verrucomicrobiota bacterium]MBT7700714.1 Flp pilus assembly complex ATPase component TadA [Verrucomicrobiota bacterium]